MAGQACQLVADEQAQLLADARVVLGWVDGLISRAEAVQLLRRAKGKGLSPSSVELLGWVCDGLEDLAAALNPEAAR